jgi:glycine betaine/proline transport system substrate-binding protein
MSTTKIRTRGAGGGVAITVAAMLAACGSSSSGQSSASASASAGGGITVKAAEFTWAAAEITDDVIAHVAKTHPQLGVAKLQTTTLDPAPGWAGAERGDLDLLTEVAWPNQQPLYAKAASEVKLVSTTYTGAVQGWFVPSYVVAPGGPAAGLTSVTQLNKYKSVFGDKLYDGDPGWLSTTMNIKRLKGYGIDYQDVASGGTAELAQLKRAYALHQPIVLYLYHPLWVFAKYKLTQLTEPRPYAASCFSSGSGDCAMPSYEARIAIRNDLEQKAPKFVAMLKRFEIPLSQMETMMAEVNAGQSATAVADGWAGAHSSLISSWTS